MKPKHHFLHIQTEELQKAVEVDGRADFAEKVGIHPKTLRQLLKDDWQRIERTTVEAICDYLGWDLKDFFSFEPNYFWHPFIDAGSCRLFRANLILEGATRPIEEQATARLTEYLENFGCAVGYSHGQISKKTLEKTITDFSCIVIGAHPQNKAWQLFMASIFEAHPYDTSEENRRKLPFRFRRADFDTTFIEPPRPEGGRKGGAGIYSEERKALIVEADRWAQQDFYDAISREAHDGALILVRNVSEKRKLILLSGISRIGTEAAVDALIHDFRELQPKENEKMVIGVLDVRFNKLKSGDSRKRKAYRWVYRSGGRSPIPL